MAMVVYSEWISSKKPMTLKSLLGTGAQSNSIPITIQEINRIINTVRLINSTVALNYKIIGKDGLQGKDPGSQGKQIASRTEPTEAFRYITKTRIYKSP